MVPFQWTCWFSVGIYIYKVKYVWYCWSTVSRKTVDAWSMVQRSDIWGFRVQIHMNDMYIWLYIYIFIFTVGSVGGFAFEVNQLHPSCHLAWCVPLSRCFRSQFSGRRASKTSVELNEESRMLIGLPLGANERDGGFLAFQWCPWDVRRMVPFTKYKHHGKNPSWKALRC